MGLIFYIGTYGPGFVIGGIGAGLVLVMRLLRLFLNVLGERRELILVRFVRLFYVVRLVRVGNCTSSVMNVTRTNSVVLSDERRKVCTNVLIDLVRTSVVRRGLSVFVVMVWLAILHVLLTELAIGFRSVRGSLATLGVL